MDQSEQYENIGRQPRSFRMHRFIDPYMCDRALLLLKKQLPIDVIKKQLGISIRSARKLQAQYTLYGKVFPSKGNTMGARLAASKQNEYESIHLILKDIINSNCAVTLRGMQKTLAEKGFKKSKSSIHLYLEKMRYSRKRLRKIPMERNSKEKLIYRQKYCQMVSQIPLKNQIFLDQTCFNQHTSAYYGWAPKGKNPFISIPAHKKKCVSFLAAISMKGFEATRIIEGPVTSKHICEFLEHYLDHLEPQQILILDNARVHHAAVVKQKIAQLRRPVRYLPAYTPQLNPIQNIFSQIKGQFMLLREEEELKVSQMVQMIQDAIKNMKSKSFQKYYQHYEQWVKRGESGELFI